MNRIFEYILDLIYPPRCCFCSKIIEREAQGICAACGEKLSSLKKDNGTRILEGGVVCCYPLVYDSMVRESFLRYKFSGAVSYAETYASLLADRLRSMLSVCDVITWVPLSRRRKRKRGYDQAELLAKGTAVLLGLDCERILYKNKEAKTQSRLKDRKDRADNVKGAYSLHDSKLVEGRRILIIDDIVTTGATLSECCRVLKKAGAETVTAAAFASAE